ncbi:caspase family protein [Kitasatospora sp. NPDC058965]|uniref:caspase, EACC1-associated type n=1 Tax=Kitasatospora sp. NPDC058965 TaxID=3346682 RepID=UPI00367D0458
MTSDLRDFQHSRAVLIGVAGYEDPDFPKVPAALNSLAGMRELLTDPDRCGWPEDRLTVIADPDHAGRLAQRLRAIARSTSDILLVYYVGHGKLTTRGELCLTVTDTAADDPEVTGLPFDWVRKALRESPARIKMVILDCCFAGQAIEALGADDVADITHIAGTYTLTATTRNRTAHVPPLAEQSGACTSFTGELLELTRTGIPDGPDRLTMGMLYPELRRRLVARGLPHPNQRAVDTADLHPFIRNAAVPAAVEAGPVETARNGFAEDLTGRAKAPRRRWLSGYRLAALLASLMLSATGIYFWSSRTDTACADGVARVGTDRECVGLTDGSFDFGADLHAVSAQVLAENQHVTSATPSSAGTPWVSVVYLLPMGTDSADSATAESVRHQLEGAYLAQWSANHSANGRLPTIRLLIANTGTTADQRNYTLGRLESDRAKDHIVAAVGLGPSTTATRSVIERLTKDGIPAFASVLTADELTGIPGLVRVSPSISDQAQAMGAYLHESDPQARALLIQDSRTDDLYARDLAAAYRRIYPSGQLESQPGSYDSAEPNETAVFDREAADICASQTQVVLFAGRGSDLTNFLSALSLRSCASPITVVSGDDASVVEQAANTGAVSLALHRGDLQLLYTALAAPDAWTLSQSSFAPAATAVFQPNGEFSRAFPGEKLDDGQAITGHDAVLTAVAAARGAAVPSIAVSAGDVLQLIHVLHGANAVSGASGLISLDTNGNPVNKAFPIVRRTAAGPRVVAVSSRYGTPAVADQ